MRWTVALAIAVVLSIAIPVLFLPIWIRLKAKVGIDSLDISIAVKPPLVPWYIPFPRLSRVIGEKAADQSRSRDRRDADGCAAKPREESVTARLRQGIRLLKDTTPLVREALEHITDSIQIKKFAITGQLGAGDAFQTALLSGGVNSMASLLLKLMIRKGFRFENKPAVRFRPRYDAIVFAARFHIVTGISAFDCIRLALFLKRTILPSLGPIQLQ